MVVKPLWRSEKSLINQIQSLVPLTAAIALFKNFNKSAVSIHFYIVAKSCINVKGSRDNKSNPAAMLKMDPPHTQI